ncbi:MAG: sugar-binding transcriptional regulator [Anaerolineales bacterium]|nr:sugar-binding transcriptional regulator [Anaerolineales bacterium]MBX3005680.1 sugar-binding transcriptional regulator [Anaerolineales bacterium]MCW5888194.1 sugar-binding transcriptional regulator [Anaerolineales bacterium]
MTMQDYERMALLAQIAELYYMQNMSQAEIAHRFGFSRSKVSRLITESRETGLVQIRINHPVRRDSILEERLAKTFGLHSAHVLQTSLYTESQSLRTLGRLGAYYLSEHLAPNSTLGISWGTAIFEVAQALRKRNYPELRIVQIIGSIGYGDPAVDGPELARNIAAVFSGKYFTLNAPVIVQDQHARDTLLNERHIQEVLALGLRADYYLVGIGSTTPGYSALVRAGSLPAAEMDAIIQATGAVGDICARVYDQNGNFSGFDFNQRVVGISLQELRDAKGTVVGIAGGEAKAPAILGALRGRLIDVLITDDKAAEKVLELHSN